MGNNSRIEWTDTTWSPVTGCTKISPGCTNCYADAMCRRFWRQWDREPPPDHFKVKLHPDRLDQPLRWTKPRRVFVCSMSDLFHDDVPFSFIDRIWRVFDATPWHTYQVLTKRPERLKEYWAYRTNRSLADAIAFSNVWLGVTAENRDQTIERVPALLGAVGAEAPVRFVSVEPMLGYVNLGFGPNPKCIYCDGRGEYECGGTNTKIIPCGDCMILNLFIDWAIIGCESGPNRRPMQLEWALDLVRQCQAAGVAVFVKQLDIDGRVSKDPGEWPEELRIREYPRR